MRLVTAAAVCTLVIGCTASSVTEPEPVEDRDDGAAPARPPRADGAVVADAAPTPPSIDAPPRPPSPDAPPAGVDAGRGDDAAPPDAARGETGAAPDTRTASADAAPDAASPRDPSILPVLLIDVGGKSISKGVKTPGKMRVIEDHDGTLAGIAMRPATLETPIGLEHRGAWSLQFPKKSFSLELRDDAGNDRDLPLAGMPAESDWVLRAGYYDHTLLRDAVGFWLYRDVFGRYGARARHVEVYVDGKYQGVYLLCETIKRGRYRVDLPKVAPDAATGDLTGGYIVHLEAQDFGAGFKTSTGRAWDYGYPRADEITPAQATYVRDHFDRFEKAMMAPDFAHPTTGWARWVDLPSWVDYALFQELARNTDGYTKSSYYQKLPDRLGGKLVKAPIWDNDLSYGNFANGTHTVEGWLYQFAWNLPVPWWKKLWGDPPFRDAARCRWQALRKAGLSRAAVDAKIDALAASLRRAQPRENERWKLIGRREMSHATVGVTYAEDVAYLKTWIGGRIAWLDGGLAGPCP